MVSKEFEEFEPVQVGIACQFVKKPVEVRFLGHEMWIMECGRSEKPPFFIAKV